MFLPLILIVLIVTLIVVYLIGRHNENYWKKRGIKFHNKNRVIGPFWNFLLRKGAMFELYGELYKEYRSEPAVGIGGFLTPSLFVVDPKNVQHVLQADFSSFSHRGLESTDEPLSESLLFLNGTKWKLMRQNMSPLFTAAKLKNMYYIINRSAQDFVDYLKHNPKTWDGDCFETLSTFCNAAIGAAVFGISSESTFNSPFLKMAKSLSASNWQVSLKFALMTLSPRLFKMSGIRIFSQYDEFFIDAITQVTKKREQENVKKHDFADLCISLQKNGTMRDQQTGCEMEPTFGLLSAQALFFFLAGVDPCANTMFSTFVLLAQHPEILEKVHKEIDEHFEKHNNNVTYEVISEMEYVDKVISEALRMYPPIGYLSRQCVKDTVLPVGNIAVEKGTKMFTPIYQIHHDPELYTEPQKFDPERFSKERRPNDDIYMPFGLGNRMCIGTRYAKLQVAAGIVHVLHNFEIKLKQTGKLDFKTEVLNVRLKNVDIEFIPRSTK